jgi:hypothetical protein
MSLPALWTAITLAIAGAAAPDTAHARTAFDGGWSVRITTLRGACDSDSTFGLEIRDGVVYGNGGYDVSGRVRPNGTLEVRVVSGDQTASGSGRLSANAGSGTWHGAGSRGVCSGHWSAGRQ